MDLNGINANVNRLLTNIWNIVTFLKEFAVDGAKDVSITYINADGSESVKSFPNIAKIIGNMDVWKANAGLEIANHRSLGRFEVAGLNNNRFFHVKTNANHNAMMFYFKIVGYLYTRGAIDSFVGAYLYTDASGNRVLLHKSIGNFMQGAVDVYRNADGLLCLKIDTGSTGYNNAFVNILFWSNVGYHDVAIIETMATDDVNFAF